MFESGPRHFLIHIWPDHLRQETEWVHIVLMPMPMPNGNWRKHMEDCSWKIICMHCSFGWQMKEFSNSALHSSGLKQSTIPLRSSGALMHPGSPIDWASSDLQNTASTVHTDTHTGLQYSEYCLTDSHNKALCTVRVECLFKGILQRGDWAVQGAVQLCKQGRRPFTAY